MSLVKDEFLTEVLEKDVYKLTECYIPWDLPNNSLIYRKTSDITELNWMTGRGFKLVCSEITFSGVPSFPRYDVNYKKVIEPVDYPFVGDLTRNCFSTDRFHRDNSIPHIKAEKVKEKWLKNSLLGRRGDKVFLALDYDQSPLGFLIIIHGYEKIMVDLIGVSQKGRKVGSSLMRWLILNYPDVTIQAGTQIDNLPAINLYKKFGIDKIVDFKYVLHLHT